MERYQINLNTPINNSRELLIRDIEFDTNSFVFTLGENSEAGLNVGDTVFYERMLYAGDGEYVIVNDEAEIIEKNKNKISVSLPKKIVYRVEQVKEVKKLNELNKRKIRLTFTNNLRVFQQDLKYYQNSSIKIYDANKKLIKSLTADEISIPLKYEDRAFEKNDCLKFLASVDTCGSKKCDKNINFYEYVFLPKEVSRNSLLLEYQEDLKNAKYVIFDYCPYFYEDEEGIKTFKDDWFQEIFEKKDDECDKITLNESKFSLKIYDNYYKINIGLSADSNETSLGVEDTFASSFVNNLVDEIIPETIDMERIKYSPSFYVSDELPSQDITGITFCLHFRKRAEISDEERSTINTSFTSGNVYYDTWHIDEENRETIWWNGFNYTGVTFDAERFKLFNDDYGKVSDLIGYLNFTNDDVYYRKKKVSNSFLRLSFYTSTDPIEQKLLYYSTIFLDGNELYGKYIKQLYNLKKKGELDRNRRKGTNRINENAFVVLYPDDIRVDTKITVTNEYDRMKSSEGFNLYLFAEDKNFNFENGKKTIYMKIDFNHAGNGKTIPLIKWPKGSDGNFTALTTDNFIESLYIPVELSYLNNRYVYTIKDGEYSDNNITLVLYEPKLDNISSIEGDGED